MICPYSFPSLLVMMLSSQVLPLLAQAVSVTFLSLLLILAGDVEVNPGPGKGKERAASGLSLLC